MKKLKPKCALTPEQFNQIYPIGTEVKYYPVLSFDKYQIAHTASKAIKMCGVTVVGLDIGPACYSVANIEPTGYIYVKDEDGFAVKKLISELSVGDIIISFNEYKEIVNA